MGEFMMSQYINQHHQPHVEGKEQLEVRVQLFCCLIAVREVSARSISCRRRHLRILSLLVRERVVSNIQREAINTVSLSELNVGRPVIDSEGGSEANDVVRHHDLGNAA